MSQVDDSESLSQDRIFDLLSNPRRRFVLQYLSSRSEAVPLRELADEVARWETGETTLSSQQRKRVYVSLYQTHIPRLHDAGVLEYDAESGEVRLVDRARELDQYVPTATDRRRWPLYYIGVGLVGILVYLIRSSGLVPGLTDLATIVIVIGLLLAVSAVHFASTWRREAFQMDLPPPGDRSDK